uniref:Uncharacterized protein n=1 Tax=Arundo donax TaxID=35708 RepID=A0A0A9FEE1_ARUDO
MAPGGSSSSPPLAAKLIGWYRRSGSACAKLAARRNPALPSPCFRALPQPTWTFAPAE